MVAEIKFVKPGRHNGAATTQGGRRSAGCFEVRGSVKSESDAWRPKEVQPEPARPRVKHPPLHLLRFSFSFFGGVKRDPTTSPLYIDCRRPPCKMEELRDRSRVGEARRRVGGGGAQDSRFHNRLFLPFLLVVIVHDLHGEKKKMGIQLSGESVSALSHSLCVHLSREETQCDFCGVYRLRFFVHTWLAEEIFITCLCHKRVCIFNFASIITVYNAREQSRKNSGEAVIFD